MNDKCPKFKVFPRKEKGKRNIMLLIGSNEFPSDHKLSCFQSSPCNPHIYLLPDNEAINCGIRDSETNLFIYLFIYYYYLFFIYLLRDCII